jgi:hypothetical protein
MSDSMLANILLAALGAIGLLGVAFICAVLIGRAGRWMRRDK